MAKSFVFFSFAKTKRLVSDMNVTVKLSFFFSFFFFFFVGYHATVDTVQVIVLPLKEKWQKGGKLM